MTERKLKTGRKMVRFDEMATNVVERVDPGNTTLDRYVGLEHLDSESLKIQRWGTPKDVTGEKLRFWKGDIIFGRRRAYQRKLAVADFEGICSAHAMVLRAKSDIVLPEFLPFFMQSDLFMNRALEISVGSLSPTINWRTMAEQEFALPPVEEQRTFLELLTNIDQLSQELLSCVKTLSQIKNSVLQKYFGSFSAPLPTWERMDRVCTWIGDGTHLPPPFTDQGVAFLLVSNISSGKLIINGCRRVALKSYQELTRNFRPAYGDVLFSLVGSYGIPVFVDWEWDFVFQRHLGILRANNEKMVSKYLYYFLSSLPAKYQAERTAEGLAQKTITLKSLRNFRIPVPDIAIQVQIVDEIDSIDESFGHIDKRLSSLTEMKANILRRLVC